MTTKLKVIAGIVVVWLLGLTIFFAVSSTKAPAVVDQSSTNLGAQIQNEAFWFNNGIQQGQNGIGVNYGPTVIIGPGQNQGAWKNNTGKTVYVSTNDTNIITTNASSTIVASTSMYLWVGTSTTATVADNSAPIYGSVLDRVLLATSSPVGTVHDGILNSAFSGSNEQGTVAVPNGAYLITVMESVNGLPVGEAATSTNRGFNLAEVFSYWNQ